MKKVIVKGPGVKLNNKWCFKGHEEIISEEEYLKNEKYVKVVEELEDETKSKERIINLVIEDETVDLEELKKDLNEYVLNYSKKKEDEDDEEEMETLRKKAEELGINVTKKMKKETILNKIKEAEEAKKGEGQNPKGE